MPRSARIALGLFLAGALACEEARRPGGTNPPTNTRRDAASDEDARTVAQDAGGPEDARPGASDALVLSDAQAAPDALVFSDARVQPDALVFDDAQVQPDASLPPVVGTISDIRLGLIPFGATVTLTDVVVTGFHDEAMRPDTVWVQDPRAGASNAGVKVYIRGAHTASRDARVDVTGVVTDYFGETEIDQATVTSRGTFTALAPTPMTVSEAMAEEREGMLVRLTDVSSVVSSYSCAIDNATCMDTRLWEVNGAIVVYDFLYESFDWDSRIGATGITGVMTWRYDRRRIMPRVDADLSF